MRTRSWHVSTARRCAWCARVSGPGRRAGLPCAQRTHLRAGHYRKDELLCDLKVGALLLAADVVRVAVDAFVQDRDEGVRHVLDVDEVARVGPVPVEAARLALHKPPDELGHNLLRVLVRAVDVVAA
eukprot:4644699-Prymnesium_polylepis.1